LWFFFKKDFDVPRAGFEPATTRSSASPSVKQVDWVERSPRLSYLGGLLYHFMMAQGFLSFLVCFLVELRICLLFMLEFQMILWPVKKIFP
jgi:hypothetical protein